MSTRAIAVLRAVLADTGSIGPRTVRKWQEIPPDLPHDEVWDAIDTLYLCGAMVRTGNGGGYRMAGGVGTILTDEQRRAAVDAAMTPSRQETTVARMVRLARPWPDDEARLVAWRRLFKRNRMTLRLAHAATSLPGSR